MKAAKSQSVQTLIIGMVACSAMTLLFMYFGKRWGYDSAAVLSIIPIVVGVFATGFVGQVAGNKIRDGLQARNGQYYHEKSQTLKNAE